MAGPEGNKKRRDPKNHYRRAALLHPLRRRILHVMSAGWEANTGEIAVALDETLARISYHLRVLVRRDALKVVAKAPPAPAQFRWSPQAHWVHKMLDEGGEIGGQRT